MCSNLRELSKSNLKKLKLRIKKIKIMTHVRLVSVAFSSAQTAYESFDVYLLLTLTFRLLSYLVHGTLWVFKLLRLCLFVCFLLPSFLSIVVYYVMSKNIKTERYGHLPRNSLDVYLPVDFVQEEESKNQSCWIKWLDLGRLWSHQESLIDKVPIGHNPNGLRKVVVFVSGGAWTIGYKCWGALFGKSLSEKGVICVCVDYRNFPQSRVAGMLYDIRSALIWIRANIINFGGDPDDIHLCGQSAGAHLAALFLLHHAKAKHLFDTSLQSHISQPLNALPSAALKRLPRKQSVTIMSPTLASGGIDTYSVTLSGLDENTGISTTILVTMQSDAEHERSLADTDSMVAYPMKQKRSIDAFSAQDSFSGDDTGALKIPFFAHPALPNIKSFIGISGPYDISREFIEHMASRGFHSFIVNTIFSGASLQNQSPQTMLDHDHLFNIPDCISNLPDIFLFHGSHDKTVPFGAARNFAKSLRQKLSSSCSKNKVYMRRYWRMSHTDPIIENPIDGDDFLVHDILDVINGKQSLDCSSCNDLQIAKPLLISELKSLAAFILSFLGIGSEKNSNLEVLSPVAKPMKKVQHEIGEKPMLQLLNSQLVECARLVNPF